MRVALLLSFIVASIHAFAQPKVKHGPAPAWITHHEFTDNISDTTETSDGYAYLLISRQSHLETKENYVKYVMKVTSENGLSAAASINEYFGPSFQQMIFHELNVIRNGKKINKLDPAKFDVIRREEDLERAMYDKSVNAIYNLPDVRVGDIVEYAFTRKGANPVYDGHSFGVFYMQYAVPVSKLGYKLVYNPQRELQFKNFRDIGTTAVEQKSGTFKSIEWVKENAEALLTDDQLPSWYDAYPYVQYTDFKSWDEVKHWAAGLFNFPKLRNSTLNDAIATIKNSGKSDEEKIKEAIRVTQGDIRYLSFSDGVNSYKPHSPEVVYDQKYGDCKDKSFMLALILTELGIRSSPALVDTELGYVLPEMLPTPNAFDHCIVQFVHNDSTYWIDPTLNVQLGPLKSYYFPTYHHALVVHEKDSGLTAIPFEYKNSLLDVKEEYSMDEVGGYVELKVSTTYMGDEADDIRNYIRTRTSDEINKSNLNFYAKDYSEISLAKDFEFIDDTLNNVITTSEEYLVKNFWNLVDGNKSADIYAALLASYLKKPQTRIRTMPLSLAYPRDIRQTIKIYLPEEWNIEDSKIEIESDAFLYRRSRFYADNVITMRFEYSTKAGFVDAEQSADHISKIEEVLDDNGYTIYKEPPSTSDKSASTYVIVTMALIVGVFIARKKLLK
jgi:transglutaminase-like putative cysteine protease